MPIHAYLHSSSQPFPVQRTTVNKYGRPTMLPKQESDGSSSPAANVPNPRRSTRPKKPVSYPTTALRNGEPVHASKKSKSKGKGKQGDKVLSGAVAKVAAPKFAKSKLRMAGESGRGNATLAMRRGRAMDWIWIPEVEEMMVEEREMGERGTVAVRGRV